MRTFQMYRKVDVTGASGAGFVADGVVFFSGKVIIHWRTGKDSIVHWDSIEDALAIHGHDGRTVVLWDDEDWVGVDGAPRHFYAEGLSNLVTGEVESHRSPVDHYAAGWLRPSEYVRKKIDPKIMCTREREAHHAAYRLLGFVPTNLPRACWCGTCDLKASDAAPARPAAAGAGK